MDKNNPLSEQNIKKFVAAWYAVLDIHAPAEECHRYLASENLEMAFPERTLRSYVDYDEWLTAIYETFFDENHTVQSVTVRGRTDTTADVDVVVGWQASWFTPPDAKSRRTAMNAIQRWTIQRSDKNAYGLEILKYHVDRFDFAPGFAQL
ncbi:hypothetical protein WMF38_07330 [Sorangium sp. So ce118]